MRIAEADQSYEAVLVNEAENDHLGVPVGSPALLIERITYDADGRPFETSRAFDPGRPLPGRGQAPSTITIR